MSPRKAYRASTCPYERRIRRKSYAGCHGQCETLRRAIRENLDYLARADEYGRDLAQDNLRLLKTRMRVAVAALARQPRSSVHA